MTNMFDGLFGESLVNLDAADNSWNEKMSPFVKGEDLDWNNEELVNEITEYAFKAPEPKKEK